MKYFIFILLISYVYCTPCELRTFKNGNVCVCNSTYCDTFEDNFELENDDTMIILTTTQAGLRFNVTRWNVDFKNTHQIINLTDIKVEKKIEPFEFRFDQIITYLDIAAAQYYSGYDERLDRRVTVVVDTEVKYQDMIGFGGTFSGAVKLLLDSIPETLRKSIYKSYYSKTEGIGYNMMKIPIGASFADTQPWAYNEQPIDDVKLSNFNGLDERDLSRIRQIKELKDITNNQNIKMIAASWSPPPWMKSNNGWSGQSSLKPEYYQTWADYHVKYLEHMSKENIEFWGITTGYAPLNGVFGVMNIPYLSLGWVPTTQGKWIAENFGPTIRNSKFAKIQIIGGDDKRIIFPWWFTEMIFINNKTRKYINALGVHSSWDSSIPSSYLEDAHKIFPKKTIINLEASIENKFLDDFGPKLGDWERAENHVKNIIQNLKHWVKGLINWNLLLDSDGNPNYSSFTADAPIIICEDEAFKQPIFYAIGHFSKFIIEGSVRIDALCSGADVDSVAYLRPDNKIILIIYNPQPHPVEIDLRETHRGKVTIIIPSKSFNSILYKNK